MTARAQYKHTRFTFCLSFVVRREIRARAKIRDGIGSHLVVFFVRARAPIGAFSARTRRREKRFLGEILIETLKTFLLVKIHS